MRKLSYIILALALSSCQWLDVKPKTMEPAETMFNTYQGYKDALAGCYIKMKGADLWGNNLTMTTVEYLAQHWETATVNTAVDAAKAHNYVDDNVKPRMAAIFDALYNTIVQANTIIEAMPRTGASAMPDSAVRDMIAGEAHAIRALCHFEVLRLFGQVPQGVATVSLPWNADVSREGKTYLSYADFVTRIGADFTAAADLLRGKASDDEFMQYRQLRLNYYAVRALQARFALYVGDTAAARTAAQEVITSSGVELAGINDTSKGFRALPSEGLFMLSNHQLADYINQLFDGGGNNLFMSAARMEADLFGEPYAAALDESRFRTVWARRTDKFGTTIFEPGKFSQSDAAEMSALDLMLRKQVVPVIRLSEVYLIAMETAADMEQANALWETYRRLRGYQARTFADTTELEAAIEQEYRREFFGEGQMFAFYKRHAAPAMLWSTKTMTESDYIVPIPDTK